MPRYDGFDRLRQFFADQFEPDGNGFLYRQNMKDAPIRVSQAERDRYVQSYDKFTRRGFWGMTAATILLILVFVTLSVGTGQEISAAYLYAGVGVIIAGFVGASRWARGLPMRELRGRGTVGEARSRTEVSKRFFAKTSYGQIAIAAAGALVAVTKIDFHRDLFSGSNLVWSLLGAFVLGASLFAALRKWRFESRAN